MKNEQKSFVFEKALAVVPFIVWMAMLFFLPDTALNYALRSIICLGLLSFNYPTWQVPSLFKRLELSTSKEWKSALAWGIPVGIFVFIFWVWPDQFAWYRNYCLTSYVPDPATVDPQNSPFSPEKCGWFLTICRLLGSAFVIAPIEELFFRSFLYRSFQPGGWEKGRIHIFHLSSFLWMIGLFALEHNRIVVALLTGVLYGFLAIRKGLGAAVLAHITTNLVLAVYIIATGKWAFW